ncbi:bifunctional 2-polyprenyl-6-hydroxyphenol methylase/3-demethylubiquinol 3-O-methyltransferase UbiG [Xanthobacter sp. TB0139]|uniref:bifunctional 2-polyprenyl-6-hydroxyphenol methylase/3-demethylubiquinol 3-O-methyltransferase UbiG n=1 Tax=Xanthobacter sp. TB0139 TaxID=3459178 RepID=UPI004039B4C3
MPVSHATVDPEEVARFNALGKQWWDEKGKMAPLHAMNPSRLAFVRDALVRHFGREGHSMRPLAGLRVVDVGCGGGLLSEPMARMGASVTGIDPAPRNIEVARNHAEGQGLGIEYLPVTAEELAVRGARFNAVVALEVVEHVADVATFIRTLGTLVDEGGVLVLSTLNRTAKSFALAIVGAEYVLRWLPPGTHNWEKFITPEELEASLAAAGYEAKERAGLVYNPLNGQFSLSDDLAVNYFMVARKAG